MSNSIRCISSNKYFKPSNIATVYKNEDHLDYVSAMELDCLGNMFFLSNQMSLYWDEKIKRKDMNWNLYRCKVGDMIRHTVCDDDTGRSGLMGFIGLNPGQKFPPENIYGVNQKDPLENN